ncbi:MAG: hypothetical protein DRH24_09670 [Deltaproteobacteria bacterium]|nr:MAG: hypothetical protein DRH24_09670 [Deltaproteobacteria bacterium]
MHAVVERSPCIGIQMRLPCLFASAILILKRYPCESGFPAVKNRGKMQLTRYLEMNLAERLQKEIIK